MQMLVNEDQINEQNKDEIDELTGADDQSNDSHSLGLLELNSLAKSSITPQELAAAYLCAFFSGSVSQKSLADFIQLSNLCSSTKLPASITGLTNLISGDTNMLK